jgi:hypothetical protein
MIKGKRTAVADGVMRSLRLAEHVDARVRELAQSEGHHGVLDPASGYR